MKAFVVDRYKSDSALRLGEMPEPEVRDNDVLVAATRYMHGHIRTGSGRSLNALP
jgi:hypothetical protein